MSYIAELIILTIFGVMGYCLGYTVKKAETTEKPKQHNETKHTDDRKAERLRKEIANMLSYDGTDQDDIG